MLSDHRCVGLFLFKAKVRPLSTSLLIPEEKCRVGPSDCTTTPQDNQARKYLKPSRVGPGSAGLLLLLPHPSLSTLLSHSGSALLRVAEVLVQVHLVELAGEINTKKPKSRSPMTGRLLGGPRGESVTEEHMGHRPVSIPPLPQVRGHQ